MTIKNTFSLRGLTPALLKVTGYHPLYSETRGDWVKVKYLEEGEVLRTFEGTQTIVKKERVPGRFKVFNIEVEGDYRYFAGEHRVLSHNSRRGDDDCNGPNAERTLDGEYVETGDGMTVKDTVNAEKGERAQQNKLQGDAFRDEVAADLATRKNVAKVETEVTVNTPGRDRRVDIRVTMENGKTFHVETKSGGAKHNDKLQVAKDNWIHQTQGIQTVPITQQGRR